MALSETTARKYTNFSHVNGILAFIFWIYIVAWHAGKSLGIIPENPAWFYLSRLDQISWAVVTLHSFIVGLPLWHFMLIKDRFFAFLTPLLFYGVIVFSNTFQIVQLPVAIASINQVVTSLENRPSSSGPDMIRKFGEYRAQMQSIVTRAKMTLLLATLTFGLSLALGLLRLLLSSRPDPKS